MIAHNLGPKLTAFPFHLEAKLMGNIQRDGCVQETVVMTPAGLRQLRFIGSRTGHK